MCKTHQTQNFHAPTLSWYSFGDICRPLQPSHLKNHEFQFFTKLPTKPFSCAVVHNQPGLCAKPTELKLSCTKTFLVFIWGHLEPFPTLTSQKPRIWFFHKNSPPSHLAMPRCTANLGYVMHQDFHGIHLGTFVGLCNPHISKITNFNLSQNSPRSHLAMPWCTDQLGHVQNPLNSKLLCTKTFMVFIWGHLEAFPTLTSQKSRISIFHKTPHQAI